MRTDRRGAAALASLVFALACGDAMAPRPSAVAKEPGITMAVGDASATLPPIEDALRRIVPTLSDDRLAQALGVALESLTTALSQPNAAIGPPALERADRALDAYVVAVGATSGEWAELDAIALALAPVRSRLGVTSAEAR